MKKNCYRDNGKDKKNGNFLISLALIFMWLQFLKNYTTIKGANILELGLLI